jgi:hypothetical protein
MPSQVPSPAASGLRPRKVQQLRQRDPQCLRQAHQGAEAGITCPGLELVHDAGTLRLDAGTTKNDDGREAYMSPELRRLMAAQIDRVRALERGLGRINHGHNRLGFPGSGLTAVL